MIPAARNAKRRVLIVEDETDIRDMLAYNLKQEGYDVATVDTGGAALDEVNQFGPDLVVLDLMLPDISGVEVCRRIRGRDAAPQPAVIMLTAKGEEIDRVVGFEVGADDYVVKPFSVRELVLRVRARMQEVGRPDERRRPSPTGPGASTSATSPSTPTPTGSASTTARWRSACWRCSCCCTWPGPRGRSAPAGIC